MRVQVTIVITVVVLGAFQVSRAEIPQSILKAVPPRIVLGALDYGPMSESKVRFKLTVQGIQAAKALTNIDCSQAKGIKFISEEQSGTGLVVEFEADKGTLVDNQPFGAYIKRQIRFETDCPEQPQFVVPVIGWLDINHSSRDFSQFVFLGHPRCQGPWASPNVAGAILASCALLLMGGAGWLQVQMAKREYLLLPFALAAVGAGVIAVLWFLCATYSREAWLAFFLASGAMAFCSSELRRSSLIALAVFAVCLSLTSSGVQRLESSASLNGDLSVANRLKLWLGAMQMMTDHPISGVGVGGFQSNFERDYQQFGHVATTSTAVSDFLTIGAEHGVYCLSILLGPSLLLLAWSFHLSRQRRSLPLLVLATVWLTLMMDSAFSTLLSVPTYHWLAVFTIGGLCWYSILLELRRRDSKIFAFEILLQTSKWTVATCIALFCLGMVSLRTLPTGFSSYEMTDGSSTSIRYDQFAPRWSCPKGTLIYFGDLSNEAKLSHSTLRPIAAMGWRVIPISSSGDSASVHRLIRAIHENTGDQNIFIAGEADGGRQAWKVAAQESPDIIKAGGGFDFLSADMDSARGNVAPTQPFFVSQSLYSDGTASNPAICAHSHTAFKGLPLTVVLNPSATSHFSAGWLTSLSALSNFFDHELACR